VGEKPTSGCCSLHSTSFADTSSVPAPVPDLAKAPAPSAAPVPVVEELLFRWMMGQRRPVFAVSALQGLSAVSGELATGRLSLDC
jgi:hypothetical protein